MIIKNKFTGENKINLMYLLIFSIVLTPIINFDKIPAFRLEQVIVVFYMASLGLKLVKAKEIPKLEVGFISLYLGFSILMLISIGVGYFQGVNVVVNDFFELYRVLVYVGIFKMTSDLVVSEKDKKQVINFLILTLLISLIISVQQYFNLFNLNEKYVPYIAPTQYITLVDNYRYPRVVGMTSNPNVYSLMPGMGAIISWALLLDNKKLKDFIFLSLFVLGTLMTGSRSGFIFMASGIFMYTLLYLLKLMRQKNITFKSLLKPRSLMIGVFVLVGIFLILVALFYILPSNLTRRLVSGFNIKDDLSFQTRLNIWREQSIYIKNSPLFGIGPAKSIKLVKQIDNEWLLLLRQYGFIGTGYLLFVFVYSFVTKHASTYKYIYVSILFGCILYMIPSIVYNTFQVMPLIIMFAALINKDKKRKI